MKKSTAKLATEVNNLGTKRTCPKCPAKFYDFNKKELTCPKCNTEFDASTTVVQKFAAKPEKKERQEPAAAMIQNDESADNGPEFESVDDLGDDDDTEDIDVVADKEDEEF